jgi:hypothetical protein
MSQPDGLEPRVAALEAEVRELKSRVRSSAHDAAAARVLAGGADHDVAEIRGEIRDFRRATTASFNAMREDFSDLRTGFENGFAEIRGRLDAAAAGQEQIVGMLNTLIERQGDQSSSS